MCGAAVGKACGHGEYLKLLAEGCGVLCAVSRVCCPYPAHTHTPWNESVSDVETTVWLL